MSLPSKSISPLTILPGDSINLRMLSPRVVFPLPDSPTSPSVYPDSGISRAVLSRATFDRESDLYSTVRLEILRKFPNISRPQSRIQYLFKGKPDQSKPR